MEGPGRHTWFDNSSKSLGSSIAKELAGLVNKRTKFLGEVTRRVGNKADVGNLGVIAKLVVPGLGHKGVIDSNNEDVRDTLVLELLAELDVTRGVRSRAGGRESAGDTNNNRLAL